MSKKPLVSIIIPTLNRGELLKQTLKSVFRQSYKNFEVIVIDDYSNDNTGKLLEPFLKKDNFVYLRKNIKKNISRSRNFGIKIAEGDLIAFLDSDDLWFPKKLEKQVAKFKENPKAWLVYSDGITFYNYGKIKPHRYILGPAYTGKVFNKLYHQGNFIPTSSILVKKCVLDDIGDFDENLAVNEDVDLLLRICHKYEIDCVSEPLIKYRVHLKRISEDKIQMKINLQKVKKKYKEWV